MSNGKHSPNITFIIQGEAFPSCQSSYMRPPPGDWRKENPFALFEPLTKQQRCVWLLFAATKYELFYSYLTQIALLVLVLIACSNRTINTFTLHVILKLVTNCNYSVSALQQWPARLALVPISFPLLRASFIFVFLRSHEKKDGKQKLRLIHMTRCYSILGNPSKPLLTYLRVHL